MKMIISMPCTGSPSASAILFLKKDLLPSWIPKSLLVFFLFVCLGWEEWNTLFTFSFHPLVGILILEDAFKDFHHNACPSHPLLPTDYGQMEIISQVPESQLSCSDS